ncbi:hypothetical protein FCV25MIE_16158, partial [Fagus crenata]
ALLESVPRVKSKKNDTKEENEFVWVMVDFWFSGGFWVMGVSLEDEELAGDDEGGAGGELVEDVKLEAAVMWLKA